MSTPHTIDPQDIVDIITQGWIDDWTSPTVRQICERLGGASTCSVANQLDKLVSSGRLERRQASPLRVLYRVPR